MNCNNIDRGVWEISFPPEIQMDMVRAEALCALLRTMHTHASHFTDYSSTKLRIKHATLDNADQVKDLIRRAAELRADQMLTLI